MRKIISVVFLVLCTFGFALGQEYHILHVKGRISVEGKPLKPGDKINADAKIKFESRDAVAAALSPEKGRYIIRVDKSNAINSDLIYILSTTISPVRGGMSTRAGGITNELNLRSYFGSAPYVWVGDKIVLEISEQLFPMDERHFFFLRYVYKDEVINKRLQNEGNKLIFSKAELFLIDGEPIIKEKASEFELYYYNVEFEESEIISPAFFVYLDASEVIELYDSMEGIDDRDNEVASILSEFYGHCDPKQLAINLDH